ncbi:hypothetical protein GCM10023191_102350 [Actinoallomurus oryzae]|uniref:Uncharacterized protein n=1 Tax=Actinoallomurus oryzae TaxID=502180 RepID=A0ABP8RAH8_9ACTN
MSTRTVTTVVQVTRPDGTTFVSEETLQQAAAHYPSRRGYHCKPLVTHVDATGTTPVSSGLSHQDRDLLLHAQLAVLLEKVRAAVAAHRAGEPDPLVHLIDHLDKLGLLPPADVPPDQLLGQARECAALVGQIADRMLVQALTAGGEAS